jgi:hypothetical protein
MSLLSSALRKITLKGVIKDVAKVASVVVPFAVAGPLGGLAGAAIGAAVKPKQTSADATPPEAYGLPLPAGSSASSTGLGGAIRSLGSSLIDAVKKLGSAESGRIQNATQSAVDAAIQDVLNIATGIRRGSSAAAGAIANSPTGQPAGLGGIAWIAIAIVIAVLLLMKGKR